MQEHQREQAVHLWVFGHRCELPGESYRLCGEVDIAGVALVEHEVQHLHHGGKIARLIDAADGDGALRPADALRHRRFRHEVCLGDL